MSLTCQTPSYRNDCEFLTVFFVKTHDMRNNVRKLCNGKSCVYRLFLYFDYIM